MGEDGSAARDSTHNWHKWLGVALRDWLGLHLVQEWKAPPHVITRTTACLVCT